MAHVIYVMISGDHLFLILGNVACYYVVGMLADNWGFDYVSHVKT